MQIKSAVIHLESPDHFLSIQSFLKGESEPILRPNKEIYYFNYWISIIWLRTW